MVVGWWPNLNWSTGQLLSGELTQQWNMAIEIVDFPIKNGGSFHCYVSSPEGIPYICICQFQDVTSQFLTYKLYNPSD